MYHIYHIPGKKIGATCDLYNRVTVQQGYLDHEYEVLFSSENINEISKKELFLQKQFGYKIDETPYKYLKMNTKKRKKMKINVTEQTTTFPIPVRKLKGRLMDMIGFEWKTDHGNFVLNLSTIEWIVKNALPSQFNNERSFIYNKAFAEAVFRNNLHGENSYPNEEYVNVYDLIRQWAKERGIYEKGDAKTQYVKLIEEAGELAQALLKNDNIEVMDAIGDMVVVLTNLAYLRHLTLEECVESAYNVISKRNGKMINGTFVKETL